MPAYIPKAKHDAWRTPGVALQPTAFAFGGAVDLDPCASVNPAHHFARWNVNPGPFEAEASLDPGQISHPADGLLISWAETIPGTRRPKVFVNPPFSGNRQWTAKCAREARAGAEIILLIPARTDTRYWHEDVMRAQALCFWKGRLTFSGAKNTAPFPVAFAYWGPHPDRFTDAFRHHGQVLSLE